MCFCHFPDQGPLHPRAKSSTPPRSQSTTSPCPPTSSPVFTSSNPSLFPNPNHAPEFKQSQDGVDARIRPWMTRFSRRRSRIMTRNRIRRPQRRSSLFTNGLSRFVEEVEVEVAIAIAPGEGRVLPVLKKLTPKLSTQT